jgi:hypothetical protein
MRLRNEEMELYAQIALCDVVSTALGTPSLHFFYFFQTIITFQM